MAIGIQLYHWLNLIEGIAWLCFAALVLRRYLRHQRSPVTYQSESLFIGHPGRFEWIFGKPEDGNPPENLFIGSVYSDPVPKQNHDRKPVAPAVAP